MILEDERRWRLDDPNHIEEEHNNCQETTLKGGTVDPVAGLPGSASKRLKGWQIHWHNVLSPYAYSVSS